MAKKASEHHAWTRPDMAEWIAEGQRNLAEHGRLLAEIERICAERGVPVPRAPIWTLDAEHTDERFRSLYAALHEITTYLV